jgi:hypothetical protein
MEGVESLTGGADLSAGHGRAELGRLGRGEGGKERERAAQVGPNSAQPRGVSLFLFLISISFLFLFYFCFFLFLFPLNQKFSK